MAIATNLGFPRIGVRRELKRAVEGFWQGDVEPENCRPTARSLRRRHWQLQRDAGIEHIPSNDFSLYDHVLDTAAMVGAVPKRFRAGRQGRRPAHLFRHGPRHRSEAAPLDMTKWFDTNYHYLVPEFEAGRRSGWPRPSRSTPSARPWPWASARGRCCSGRSRSCCWARARRPAAAAGAARAVAAGLRGDARRLARRGAEWVQIDEPVLALDLPAEARRRSSRPTRRLARRPSEIKICLATYFGDLGENLAAALRLPVAAVHLDLVRAPEQLDRALEAASPASGCCRWAWSTAATSGGPTWSGRFALVERRPSGSAPSGCWSAPPARCCTARSTWSRKTALDGEVQGLAGLRPAEARRNRRAGPGGQRGPRRRWPTPWPRARPRRAPRPLAADPSARGASSGWRPSDATMLRRAAAVRRSGGRSSRRRLRLPLLPTTTIGSFPQTAEVRKARAALKKGDWTAAQYEDVLPRGDRADGAVPGGDRPGRAGPRRVRAQRHGRVLRRAARRLRLHRATAGCRATARAA